MDQNDITKAMNVPAEDAARQLLGSLLIRELPALEEGEPPIRLIGRIVETEAYDQSDAASHSYKGRTERTAVMFGPPGRLYVYFTYGMHYCCNIVTGPQGSGAAVLIRAIEPIEGQAEMLHNRQRKSQIKFSSTQLTNGPAKLCQALQIDKTLNGHNLLQAPLRLELQKSFNESEISQTTRIGISQAKEVPWRFYVTNNQFVSQRW